MSEFGNLLSKVKKPDLLTEIKQAQKNQQVSMNDLFSLIQFDNYIGEIVEMQYSNATVQISDYHRQKVGGISSQSFLIATRIHAKNIENHDENFYNQEDCSVILLRVLDSAELPHDMERKRIRSEIAETTELHSHWEEHLDASSKKAISFAGINCRILGTFYLEKNQQLELKFGSDISNYYPNRGLKVFKPTHNALEKIVNFGLNDSKIKIGDVRYSSTRRIHQGVDNVPVFMNPEDLISQKTAVFGMTRTGKSNTVKTIVKSIYQMRFDLKYPKTIGQVIFDPNGEYANANLQDKNDITGEAESISNLWQIPVNGKNGKQEDVQIYSLLENKGDDNRKLMKINFYDDSMISIGKELIDFKIENDGANTSSHYIRNFINLRFEEPSMDNVSEVTRYKRKVLVYKTLLFKSNFEVTNNKIEALSLFNDDLIKALHDGILHFEDLEEKDQQKVMDKKNKYEDCAKYLTNLKQGKATYTSLVKAFEYLYEFIQDPQSTYQQFNKNYVIQSESGLPWADNDLEVLLTMFSYSNASRQIAKASVFHHPLSHKGDYADLIYSDLVAGKLVIIDQALGDSQINKIAASRILHKIFVENSKKFANAQSPSEVLIYAEEAHNLMPRGSEEDTTNIWARVAKEGAKFKIGMVYSTQEVSSIQRNILKNTTNWFISHLNNKEETRALEVYYDFEDFSQSILKAEDKGFIRMKTKSNKFVVPIQVDKFQINSKLKI
jgi:DNA helicase HerA-like ATPase